MREYVNELKATTLLARGIADDRLLEGTTELDQAIIKLAGRVLQKSEKLVFFFTYICKPTWDDILELLHTHLKKEYKLQTVKDYATSAYDKITSAAKTAPELNEWQTKFSQSQKKN